MKKEIEDIDDIKQLVDSFYKKVIVDKTIAHFFINVITVNWDVHLPIMYSFWDTVLFGSMSYKGNPMLKHIALSQKEKLDILHFDAWIKLWEETIDELFFGEKAQEAKKKAQNIKALMMYKIDANKT